MRRWLDSSRCGRLFCPSDRIRRIVNAMPSPCKRWWRAHGGEELWFQSSIGRCNSVGCCPGDLGLYYNSSSHGTMTFVLRHYAQRAAADDGGDHDHEGEVTREVIIIEGPNSSLRSGRGLEGPRRRPRFRRRRGRPAALHPARQQLARARLGGALQSLGVNPRPRAFAHGVLLVARRWRRRRGPTRPRSGADLERLLPTSRRGRSGTRDILGRRARDTIDREVESAEGAI